MGFNKKVGITKYLSISTLTPLVLSIIVSSFVWHKLGDDRKAIELYFDINSLFMAVVFPIISIDAFYYESRNKENLEDNKLLKDLLHNKISAFVESFSGVASIFWFMVYGNFGSILEKIYNEGFNIDKVVKGIECWAVVLGWISVVIKVGLMIYRKKSSKYEKSKKLSQKKKSTKKTKK